MSDFSSSVRRALAKKGISILGITVIPGANDLPFATGDRGYRVNDNGCGRIWSFSQVLEVAR